MQEGKYAEAALLAFEQECTALFIRALIAIRQRGDQEDHHFDQDGLVLQAPKQEQDNSAVLS